MVLTDARWRGLAPLIDGVRPHCAAPHGNLRRTIEAILWPHQNGAKWRTIPAELGAWWRAAQTFIRWAKLGVWERPLELAQRRGLASGVAFLDGTSIRVHHKVAGPGDRGPTARSAADVRRYYERDHNDATAAQWNAAMVRTARREDTRRKHNAMLHALAAGAALGSPMSRKWEDHRRCADR